MSKPNSKSNLSEAQRAEELRIHSNFYLETVHLSQRERIQVSEDAIKRRNEKIKRQNEEDINAARARNRIEVYNELKELGFGLEQARVIFGGFH